MPGWLTAVTPEVDSAALLPIPSDWITQLTPAGLLGLVVLLIVLGRLVPLSAYRQLERDRDHWREAALKSIGQTEALLPAAQITTQVTKALGDAVAVERAGNPGGTGAP